MARGVRLLLPGAVLVASLGASPVVTAFLQVPDEPSPKSGTAQVVAQGVVSIAAEDWRWRVNERTASPPANASPETSELGFLVVESGAILVENLDTGEQTRLPAGEAMMSLPGSQQVRVALGSDTAVYRELALVDATEATDDPSNLFSGDPFPGPGASHDLDLLLDSLAPGAQLAVPGGTLPTLIFILAGGADVATESGDVFSLGAGEAVSLSGALAVTAAENGTEVAAVYTGPAVPRLAQAAATPAAEVRQIESADAEPVATVAASPTAEAASEPSADDNLDADGDGLTAAQEAELNTDPALTDTDEDGLSDGQEALEVGTAPLAPDSDGDGILDGDEVAQGSNPLDGVAAAVAEGDAPVADEALVAEEPVATEAPPADAAAVPGDSDGDGLEDAIEAELGTDPVDADTDDDGATDGDEYYVLQTGTRNPDSDGDGVLDGTEAANGTDPNDINSF